MVTVTAVEVSPDLSHAKIFFTHLAGKTCCHRGRGLAALGGISPHRARAPVHALLRAAAPFCLRRFHRVRPTPVEAHRRRRRRRPQAPGVTASARNGAAATPPRRRSSSARQGSRPFVQRALQQVKRCFAPRRRVTRARSIRSRRDSCRSVSVRRPSSRTCCSTPPNLCRHGAARCDDDDRRCRG